MSGRVWVWAGGVLFLGAAAGMGVYLARVGLAQADQLASVSGAFIGLSGLALTIYGMAAERRRTTSNTSSGLVRHAQPNTGTGDTHNTVSGGAFHGPVVQGRDISGITLGPPSASKVSPQPPATPPAGT